MSAPWTVLPPAADRERIVRAALAEDAPWGDLTAQSFLPEHARIDATLRAREDGVLATASLLEEVFGQIDPAIRVERLRADGTRFGPGDALARIHGPARGIVTGERVALNLVQRLSGIATLTRSYVDAVQGTAARIADTRKTTPGLRILERYAVRCGGGHNHRFGLSDAVMIKDNHLAAVAGAGPGAVTAALRAMRGRLPHTAHVVVEVDRLDQIEAVLDGGAHTILLDNMSPEELVAGRRLIAGRAAVEASGGVSLDSVAAIARTGVDVISVGALTHSARALDLGLDVDLDVPGR